MSKKTLSKPADQSPVEITVERQAEMGAQLTEQYQKACNAMPEIVRFGAMMIRLRQVLFHDGKASGNNVKDTGIKAWMEKHAPEVKLSTAYRFEDVTIGLSKEYEEIVGSKVAKKFALSELVTTEASKLPDDARKKQQALFDYVAGTSQKSWLDKIRPQKPSGNPGNNHPKCPHCHGNLKSKKQNPCPHCKGDTSAEPEKDSPQQAAIDIWTPTFKALANDGLKEKSWADLPDHGEVSRETLEGLIIDLGKLLRESRPEEKGGKK